MNSCLNLKNMYARITFVHYLKARVFVNKSDKELGVQVADFVAGTLGYIFDEHKRVNIPNIFSKYYLEKLLALITFLKFTNLMSTMSLRLMSFITKLLQISV